MKVTIRAGTFEIYPEGVVYEIDAHAPVRVRMEDDRADELGWIMRGLGEGGFLE